MKTATGRSEVRRAYRCLRSLLLVAVCGVVPAVDSAATESSCDVALVVFPLASAAPLYVAAEQGFFEREGLSVTLTETNDSTQLVAGLVGGQYQLAAALVDNFIAYESGQHSVSRQPGRHLAVALGLSTTSAALVARSGIESLKAIGDARVGVDAPNTGFALLLYRLLASEKLAAKDVTLVRSGSTAKRYVALTNGEIDATMLTPEFSGPALERGFRIIADSREVVGRYMGMGVGVERSWASANPECLRRFSRATRASLHWLRKRQNNATAAAILARHLNVPHSAAMAELQRMHRHRDFSRDGRVDMPGLRTVLEVRQQFGVPPVRLAPAGQYLLP